MNTATTVPSTMASRIDRREMAALPTLLKPSTMTSEMPASAILLMLP